MIANLKKRLRYQASNLIYRFRDKKYLEPNKELRNLYKGKRCFVIGNGSSLSQMDLTRLKSEHVFCVGSFYLHKDLRVINPAFYTEIEPKATLDNLPEDSYYHSTRYFKTIDKAWKDLNPIMFFNLQWKNYIEENRLFKGKKIYYFTSNKGILDQEELNDDISEYNSFMDGAIYFTICAAAYLGFKEIYFIGCDCDWFAKKRVTHFYPELQDDMVGLDNETLLYNNYMTLKKWRIVTDHFKKKGIKIYNAGLGGENDTCDRIDFKQITSGSMSKSQQKP